MKKEFTIYLIFIVVMFFLTLSVVQTLGLSRSGLDSLTALNQWYFYEIPFIGFAVGILILLLIELIITKDDVKYGNSIFFFSPGEFPAVPLKFLKRWFVVALGGLIIILSFYLILSFLPPQTSQTILISDVGVLAEQFTPTDNIIYNILLIPIPENLGAFFAAGFFLLFFRMLARKYDINKITFQAMSWLIFIFSFLIYGILNHLLHYSTNDTALFNVAVFWTIGAIITILSGAFLLFWELHAINNLFYDLNYYHLMNDITRIYIGGVILILVIIFIFIVFRPTNNGLKNIT